MAAVRVHGLRELSIAFRKLDKDLNRELRGELKKAAEPVRTDAARLAVQEISHIGPRWSEMRTGVTTSLVYVAPKAKRSGGSPRPNLAPLLLDRAMFPALETHEGDIVHALEGLIDRLGNNVGF